MKRKILLAAGALLGFAAMAQAMPAAAAEIKVLTAGAFKQVLLEAIPAFEKTTGHKVTVDNDTVGALVKRIDGGEVFDLVVLSPGAIKDLAKKGKVVDGIGIDLARVGVGVMVKEGAPKPDIGSVEAFKQAVLAAKSVAYIDPASGGSSGVYVEALFAKLGIADQVKPKAKLKKGGHVADLISSGEAELGIHQISEIVSEKGVTLVGPLPAEIQNYTTYTVNLATTAKGNVAAATLFEFLAGPALAPILKAKGMEPAH
jgi:molybdate transport system substrate-binding protein